MKDQAQKILNHAGILINGKNPWDIQVHNEKFYSRVFAQGSMGLGDSYVDGWWDVQALDQFFDKLLRVRLDKKFIRFTFILNAIKAQIFNLQTKNKARHVVESHYDIGNELYTRMLDKNMQYTCAYWTGAKNLDAAQIAKLHLICKKLKLKKGMKVLELGGGYGGLARFMAKVYGCEVVSYNISKEQVAYGRAWCKGLPVTFIEADYREAKGVYDRVVSIGLCEHIGHKNHRAFMKLAHKCLKDHGLFLLHTIASNISVTTIDPWIEKYIFQNALIPSAKQLTAAFEGVFVLEDLHNLGISYDHTLMAWHKNFEKTWHELKDTKPVYTERFHRMWRYYLLCSAGSFRSRKNQLFQIVLSKNGYLGGYESVR